MSINEFYKDLLAFMERQKKKYGTPKYDSAISNIKTQMKEKRNTNERIIL